MDNNKYCLVCSELLTGRKDKKFCNSYCRTYYHNTKNRKSTDYIKHINNILRKNRNILSELNPVSNTVVTKQSLFTKGFNFKYFTNIYVTKKKNIYKLCYDQGYRDIGNDKYLLVKHNISVQKS